MLLSGVLSTQPLVVGPVPGSVIITDQPLVVARAENG